VEDELQQQLLKAFQAAEDLLLAGLEHGSPAAKRLAAQVCKQLCGQTVGRRRVTGISMAWLETLVAALGMEQVAGTAAAAAAADVKPAMSSNQQLEPEPSVAEVLLNAIQCVAEHAWTNGQLCHRASGCRTVGGSKTAGHCNCHSCKQLTVMNLKPLLRAVQQGSSNAATALDILAGTAGVQRQLATQHTVAELLCTSWQHRDTTAGPTAMSLVCRLVQNSSFGSQALQLHMQVVVAALGQFAALSPTDLTQTLAGCLALLAMAAAPGVMDPSVVQLLHDVLGRCIPSLVQLAEFGTTQQDEVLDSAAATPAAARVLLRALADSHQELLAGTLAHHTDSLASLLAAARCTESIQEGGVSAAGWLLLAAKSSSMPCSTNLLVALNTQPYVGSLVQQLKVNQCTAAGLVARIVALDSLDVAWLQHAVLQQPLDVATKAAEASSPQTCGAAAVQTGACSAAREYSQPYQGPTAGVAAKALLAVIATRKADVLAAELQQHSSFLLYVLKATETEGSQIGVAGSLLLAATAGSTQGGAAMLTAVGRRTQCIRGILQLMCDGNCTSAVLVHRMSGLEQLDAVLLKSSRLQQLLAAALPASAPSQDISSYALKAVWALFSRKAAQALLKQ
jgi:hypothetical protein